MDLMLIEYGLYIELMKKYKEHIYKYHCAIENGEIYIDVCFCTDTSSKVLNKYIEEYNNISNVIKEIKNGISLED